MFRNFELSNELFRIYLRDESEKANISAIDAITHAFSATSGALFYRNMDNIHRFCLAGTVFPISLDEKRWRSSVEKFTRKNAIGKFSHWAPPGMDNTVDFWISAQLYTSTRENGYVFIGRNEKTWTIEEIKAFKSITGVITDIVTIRQKKDLEARSRREAEKVLAVNQRRIDSFFSLTPDMIYTIDAEGCFTNINRAGLNLFGLKNQRQILGKSFSDFALNSDVHDFFMEKIMQDGFIADLEIVLKRIDGSTVFCLESSHAVKNPDGSILEIQGLIKDISDRIENERNLWKMNLELSEVNNKLHQTQDMMVQHEKLASIGQLAAGVAHEINNPLGFLKSNQTMLRKYFDTIQSGWEECLSAGSPQCTQISEEKDMPYVFEESEHIFAESEEGFARIMRIVSNLMSFSRMDQKIEFEMYDVNAGIESTLVVAWNEIKYVAEVEKKFGELPRIQAKGGEINQVVLNILVNAAQAIAGQKREEKGHITITTRETGNSILILISDDGPGIPKKIRSRVFDPFFTTKEPGKGTGLGLSISYDIIATKHKGKISVESEPEKGTTFRIELPVLQENTP